jgi:hypothetical protein
MAKQTMAGNLTITNNSIPGQSYSKPSTIAFSGKFSPSSVTSHEMGYYVGSHYSTLGGNYKPVVYSRIDGGADLVDVSSNAGRLSFLIHKQDALVMSEVIRIDRVGRVIIGDDDAGKSCDFNGIPSRLNLAQTADTYTGGFSLINTDGNGSYLFTNGDDELQLNSGSDGSRTIYLNSGNGPVHFGNESSNSGDYVARFNGNVIPAINNSYDLGSSTMKWDNIWATNNVIQTSDARLKKDVLTSNFGLEFVKAMKPVSFRRIDGKRRHYGFLAQDLEALVRKFGRDTKDAGFVVKDEEGNYGLRDTQLIAILAKAIQELAAKVEG